MGGNSGPKSEKLNTKTVASMIREAIEVNGYKDVKECARSIKVPYDLFNKVVGGHIPKDAQLMEYAKKLKMIHETIFSINPPLNALPSVMKPDECAMATAGVPIGRINARPDGTVTANVIIIGFIEKSIAIPMAIGIKSATTAVLLMA